jgi:penicillin-binding protein 1A
MLKVLAHCFSLGSLFVLSAAFGTAAYLMPVAQDLPDYRLLAEWEPAGVARVYAGDGELVTEYARERRFPVPIQSVPEVVKQAFLSAEDKNFYSHPGLDPLGVLRAVAVNVVNLGSDQRLVGASTITQQVAKNFLLTSERSFARKAREAILSLRMEQAYSKDKILELYLNGIYLGAGAYGVEAAAQTYFAKSLDRLSAGEAALLAALPKAPRNYNPYLDRQAAIGRRNWVLGQMAANGFISPELAEREAAAPLEIGRQEPAYVLAASEYFAEEVRRTLLHRFGTDALYEAGYSITTTLDPKLQAAARAALRRGLVSFDEARGYRGPVAKLDLAGNWRRALADVEPLADVDEWRLGVVLASDGAEARLALRPRPDETSAGEVATVGLPDMKWALRGRGKPRSRVDQVLAPGDVVYVEKAGDRNRLRQPPTVQGALVSMDARTGKVLALVGGFSFAQSLFISS